ncbi:MAG: hypothetical protein LUD12_02775 [Lachnospiraceae bacterium]|nr:hypothetical protein [Lachnospiraceae bacterium]
MKEVTHYYCGICGEMYSEKKKCQTCEKSHMKPKGFGENVKYVPYTQQSMYADRNYPKWLEITFEDGTTRRYHE